MPMTTATGHQASPVSCAGATTSNIARQCRSIAILDPCLRTEACSTGPVPSRPRPGPTATGRTPSSTPTRRAARQPRDRPWFSSTAGSGVPTTTAPTCAPWPPHSPPTATPPSSPSTGATRDIPMPPSRTCAPPSRWCGSGRTLPTVSCWSGTPPAGTSPCSTAVEARVTGCLALAAVADLALAERLHLDDDAVRAFLGRPAADRPDLDPARTPRPGVATTLVHGDEDSLVPSGMSTVVLRRPGCSPGPRAPGRPLRADRPPEHGLAHGHGRTRDARRSFGY